MEETKNKEKEELEEARRVIEFYANEKSWCGYGYDCDSIAYDSEKKIDGDGCDFFVGGQRAREHKKKWGF